MKFALMTWRVSYAELPGVSSCKGRALSRYGSNRLWLAPRYAVQ